jgi:hypothetical protein
MIFGIYLVAWMALLGVPAVYAMAMTIRGGQPFQFGRFFLHLMIGGLVVGAVGVAGLFAMIMPLLDDLSGLHN